MCTFLELRNKIKALEKEKTEWILARGGLTVCVQKLQIETAKRTNRLGLSKKKGTFVVITYELTKVVTSLGRNLQH